MSFLFFSDFFNPFNPSNIKIIPINSDIATKKCLIKIEENNPAKELPGLAILANNNKNKANKKGESPNVKNKRLLVIEVNFVLDSPNIMKNKNTKKTGNKIYNDLYQASANPLKP